jgi:membrane-bound ClpP family serine protease
MIPNSQSQAMSNSATFRISYHRGRLLQKKSLRKPEQLAEHLLAIKSVIQQQKLLAQKPYKAMATKSSLKLNSSVIKIIQFLFILVGFMLLGSEQLHKQFYIPLSILGALMMLFGLLGIQEKSTNNHLKDK